MTISRSKEPACQKKFKSTRAHLVHLDHSPRCTSWYRGVEYATKENEISSERGSRSSEDLSELDVSTSSSESEGSDSELVSKLFSTCARRQSTAPPAGSRVYDTAEDVCEDRSKQSLELNLEQSNDETMVMATSGSWRSYNSNGKRDSAVENIDGSTGNSIILLYRDGLEAFRFLFNNPISAGHHQDIVFERDLDGEIETDSGPLAGERLEAIKVCFFSAILQRVVAETSKSRIDESDEAMGSPNAKLSTRLISKL